MNLYFRLIAVLLRGLFTRRIGLLDESRLRYRVWPLDCDVNLHLTNARYLSLCDLSRIYYIGQLGILMKLIKRNWLPIAQAQEISYFRPIQPFQRFEVLSRFIHWDDKYWYTEHRFLAADRLCAVVQVRGVFVHGKRIVPMADILALTGQSVAVPDKPATVDFWQRLIDSKKEFRAN
jgi:acyl-CoA thioesterase FadM